MRTPAQPGVPADAALSQAIDQLWVRFLPEIRDRVAVLEAAAKEVAARKLTDARRKAAQAAAHKLAGVLGTFNLTRGTVLAREAEVTYSRESAPGPSAGKRLAAIAAELRTMIENRPSTT
jgi:HPt (histidine-containing phosphotransfer) domain-containing protein